MNLVKNSLQKSFPVPVVVVAALLLVPRHINAEQAGWNEAIFELGNQAYEQGDYDSAIACYSKIVNNGVQNAFVYYNLGNAFFRQNRLGYAILFFEKAKKLAPNDHDIQSNLKFVQAHLVDKVAVPEMGFFSKVIQKLHGILSLKASTVVTSVLYTLICLCVILGLFARYNGRLIATYLGVVLGLCLIPIAVSTAVKVHEHENVSHAVVLVHAVNVLNEPEGSQTLFTVHQGTKFLIRKDHGDWILASLPNGMAGWVPAKHVGEI